MMKRSLLSILAILFAVLGASSCRNGAVQAKFKSDDEVPRLNVAEAKREFDAGTAVFIDSRFEDSYKFEHIAGAISIPFGSQDSMMDKLPKGKKLIIYCS